MQPAYQYPKRCERLVLVASGGLGKEVTPFLRAVALPGPKFVLPLMLHARPYAVLLAVGAPLRHLGLRVAAAKAEMWDNYTSRTSPAGRLAFLNTVREVIDLARQRVSANEKHSIIPVAHGYAAHEAVPGSRLEILEGSGHFVDDFTATTEAASADGRAFQAALGKASVRSVRATEPTAGGTDLGEAGAEAASHG